MDKWLIELLDRDNVEGLKWKDRSNQIFEISWVHASSTTYKSSDYSTLFRQWALYKGKPSDRDYKNLKATFRCALKSRPYLEEVLSEKTKCSRVWKFVDRRKGKARRSTVRVKRAGRARTKRQLKLKSEGLRPQLNCLNYRSPSDLPPFDKFFPVSVFRAEPTLASLNSGTVNNGDESEDSDTSLFSYTSSSPSSSPQSTATSEGVDYVPEYEIRSEDGGSTDAFQSLSRCLGDSISGCFGEFTLEN